MSKTGELFTFGHVDIKKSRRHASVRRDRTYGSCVPALRLVGASRKWD